MNIVSLCVFCFAATVFVAIVLRAKHNDRLAAMTESALLEESFWETQRGNDDSVYSRELARRENRDLRERELDAESITPNQL